MRKLSTFLAALTILLGAFLVSAQPAAAAGHRCAVIGTSGVYQGVHCIDVYRDGPFAASDNSVYCQKVQNGVTTIVACKSLREQPGTCSNAYAQCAYSGRGECGSAGHSPCRAAKIVNSSPVIALKCGYDYWGITANTYIVLPNGVPTSTASIATPHFAVGNTNCTTD
ncbi:hypothetical protein [Actinoplanes sp. NPDC048796]|uniref:hypothetical protein n=1 Tax=unclassified Actinoplanes TaxID=2626549 RepID=UPI0033E665A8